MSPHARRTGRGGRTGRHHSKSPKGLRSYDVPPASPVMVTRPGGTVDELPAAAPEKHPPGRLTRRGPSTSVVEPVPIEQVKSDRPPFVPANQRAGATRGWTRNGNDSLPRGTR